MDNNMDFTDIIKFFNEMAERHDVQHILKIARELVHKVQSLMDNKETECFQTSTYPEQVQRVKVSSLPR
ncbi:small G protein signaling modulator 2 [Lates japonicus]|nr:small G protein signaling modulator 2 [Lates japonicus]